MELADKRQQWQEAILKGFPLVNVEINRMYTEYDILSLGMFWNDSDRAILVMLSVVTVGWGRDSNPEQ